MALPIERASPPAGLARLTTESSARSTRASGGCSTSRSYCAVVNHWNPAATCIGSSAVWLKTPNVDAMRRSGRAMSARSRSLLLLTDHPFLVRIAGQLTDEARRLHEHVQAAAVAGHHREDEIELLFGAGDGDVEKAAFFFFARDDDLVLGRRGIVDDLCRHFLDSQLGGSADQRVRQLEGGV